ncbi:nuclear transport factor 2 family protein [Pseudonocardia acaciae]|uniref:nuclear transport factor 2 family protein n=1 Tax=Pseudonocardia acaciae TaxID=551276 RepID=UPI00048ED7D0|nr:nuclear transport factor 2 family protein [Pseudonocardia acaciae]
MTEKPSPRDVFERLISAVTGRRWDELPELYAEDTVVRHPFGPPGGWVLHGREEIREHFARGAALPLEMRAEDVLVHQTEDPEVIIGEFRYVGRFTDTDRPLEVSNIFVLRVRDGQILESRDYADHLAFAAAGGRLEEVVAAYQ